MRNNTILFACLAILIVTVSGCQTIELSKAGGPYGLKNRSELITIGANKAWSHQDVMSPEPVRAGQFAERFELRHGDCGSDAEWSDCTNDRGRTEKIVLEELDRIGQDSWYGFSIYLGKDVEDIDPAKEHLFQWKATKWRDPLATLSLWRDHLVLSMQSIDRDKCTISHLYNLRGQWMDFVVHTVWTTGKNGTFELWINGDKVRHDCSYDGPTVASGPYGKVLPHWGIYQSFVSRWLAKKTYDAKLKKMEWTDHHQDSGRKTKSVTNRPFDYDWGVELPTAIAYFDEIRIGPTRESVDIRMIEARGERPLD